MGGHGRTSWGAMRVLLASGFHAPEIQQIPYEALQAAGLALQKHVALSGRDSSARRSFASSSVMPRSAVSGERNSCETAEMKSD